MTYFKIEPPFFIFSYFWSSHALICNTVSSSSHLGFILYDVNSLIACPRGGVFTLFYKCGKPTVGPTPHLLYVSSIVGVNQILSLGWP